MNTQSTQCNSLLFALADDGSLWSTAGEGGRIWERFGEAPITIEDDDGDS